MKITVENYKTIDTNPYVLTHVLQCLKRGDNLVISPTNEHVAYGEYVCTSILGTVQRITQ